MLSIGLVVNPYAGMGGRAGVGGSDALAGTGRLPGDGWVPVARERAARFLAHLERIDAPVRVVAVGAGEMGATSLAGTDGVTVVDVPGTGARHTTGLDTQAVAGAMRDVDVIVFAGGDGTARDLCRAVGTDVPVLGLPAGVKMQSAVFARSPATAAALLAAWAGGSRDVIRREVVDLDEAARSRGVVAAEIFGELAVPAQPRYLQSRKVGSSQVTPTGAAGLAARLTRRLDPAAAWVFGPGGTMSQVAHHLGLESSLLGADLHLPGAPTRTTLLQVSADELERQTAGRAVQVVLSPIGGQGFLLGRGNQQIGADVINRLGPDDLVVVASPEKLAELAGGVLLADLPVEVDPARVAGYHRIVTGPADTTVLRVDVV